MPSPITSRTNAQPLTLELLKEHVPTVREGQQAMQVLNDQTITLTREQKNKLLIQKRQGSKAQEILIISALPLIKNIASKEFQRRRAWNSRISYDDVLQEAIAGFIRGLLSYNEESDHISPTNYLGQWITTSIRRKVEALEHDFVIPYEVIERARRIRAVRSRLNSELSHNPTDEELLTALNDQESLQRANYKWGKTKKTTLSTRADNKKFTQAHLDEAKKLASQSYGLQSYDTPTNDFEESYEKSSTPLASENKDFAATFEEEDLSKSRYNFFNTAFITMHIGSKQKDIILRYFGMEPYGEPQTQKKIIANTALPPRFVKTVIATFSTYMPLKGGVFHKLLLTTEPDIIESLELAWLFPLLGDWPEELKQPKQPPVVLTQTNTKVKNLNNI